MKWPFSIVICIFAYVSFSSSAPIFIQDDMALMYPMEYYPGYLQNDFANLDIAKWFRKAATSVKHFYNYVNNLIFGDNEGEPIFGRYPIFKENKKPENDSNDVNTHPNELNVNLPHIRAVEVYKDSNGNVVMRNLNNDNGHIQISQKVALKPGVKLDKPVNVLLNDDPLFHRMSDKIAKNPFHWNEKLEKDELFSGAFKNYDVNPELLWNSGIFPFQPMNIFNRLHEKVLAAWNKPQNNKTKGHEIECEPSTYSPSTTTDQVEVTSDKITEETQRDESSDSSDDTSNDEKNSNPEFNETNNDNKAYSDSDASQNSVMPDGITDSEGDDDDDDDEITESEPIQTSSDDSNQKDQEPSDDESDQNNKELETSEKSVQEVTTDGDDDLTIETTSKPSEGTENPKTTEIADLERIAKVFGKQNSDESDIAKRVLAIMQPSEN